MHSCEHQRTSKEQPHWRPALSAKRRDTFPRATRSTENANPSGAGPQNQDGPLLIAHRGMEGLEGRANGLDVERDDSNLLVVIMRHVVPPCPFVRAAKRIKTMIGRQSKMALTSINY